MSRFIVIRHRDIKKHPGNNELLVWKTGIVLEDNIREVTAVVKVDEEAKKIKIFVQGNQKSEYLGIIRKTLEDINRQFKRIKAVEKVPLPDSEKFVMYKELGGLKDMRVEKYIDGELRMEFNVSELLEGYLVRQ